MSDRADRDAILERLLLGGLDPESDEARAFFATDPDAREELEALKSLERALEERREARVRDVDAARSLADAPGEELVDKVLRERSSSPPPSAVRPYERLVWLAPAAAALILAVFWLRERPAVEPAGGGTELTLGHQGALTLMSPVGAVDSYPPFKWSAELEPGGWFEVWVYDLDLPPASDPVRESGSLKEPVWIPDALQDGEWPRRIRWEVFVYDSAGELDDSLSQESSLL